MARLARPKIAAKDEGDAKEISEASRARRSFFFDRYVVASTPWAASGECA
jgi:hypothetical protein